MSDRSDLSDPSDIRFISVVLGSVLWLLASVGPALACPGDCSLDREVTVDEILTLVNVALGSGSVDSCRAGDDDANGEITVDEILRAVNNALSGCPTGVVEAWVESDYRVVSSTCPSAITDTLALEVGGQGDCLTELTFAADRVTGVDCSGGAAIGQTGTDGVTRFGESTSEQVGACEIGLVIELQVDFGASPAQGSYLAAVDLSGDCPFSSCAAVIQSTWTQLP